VRPGQGRPRRRDVPAEAGVHPPDVSAQFPLAAPDPPPGLAPLKASSPLTASASACVTTGDERSRATRGPSRLRLDVPSSRRSGSASWSHEPGGDGRLRAVRYRVFDEYLGTPVPPVDWIAAFRRKAEDERKKARRRWRGRRRRVATSRPSLALGSTLGAIATPVRRREIAEEDGRLVLNMNRTPGMVAVLEHWQQDTFVARWRQAFMSDEAPADAYVTFALNPDGSIERLTMAPVSPAIDFSFDYQDLLFSPVPASQRPEGALTGPRDARGHRAAATPSR